MDPANGITQPDRDKLRQRLQAAFPRIHLEFNPERQKWFPKSGLHGSRFLGHAGLSDSQADWLLENRSRVSEMDILLERYPKTTDEPATEGRSA
ncbi:hypothetical protein [Paludibaculum fermentans]|uniref:Uncharacterized protein n=1 Tax=Paludibaculum fermentans TaxID=1473598 RepID=A0A7S7SMJ4_PALFE|nr:hypothetical protein [Paludibaculum fermentans]QOY91357.1 hypothetical protein IRI77_15830 [Paludibaculum fermentans]